MVYILEASCFEFRSFCCGCWLLSVSSKEDSWSWEDENLHVSNSRYPRSFRFLTMYSPKTARLRRRKMQWSVRVSREYPPFAGFLLIILVPIKPLLESTSKFAIGAYRVLSSTSSENAAILPTESDNFWGKNWGEGNAPSTRRNASKVSKCLNFSQSQWRIALFFLAISLQI